MSKPTEAQQPPVPAPAEPVSPPSSPRPVEPGVPVEAAESPFAQPGMDLVEKGTDGKGTEGG